MSVSRMPFCSVRLAKQHKESEEQLNVKEEMKRTASSAHVASKEDKAT